MKREEFTLDIDVFTPSTLPMARFAQYIAQFAELLGNDANVHFSRLAKGSARCKAFADSHVAPKVRERVHNVIDGSAPKPALKAHSAIDDLLVEDNAIGSIFLGDERVIEFPGRRRAVKERIGPVRRSTSIEGQIYQIGGKDDTINVHLRQKDLTHKCEVSIDLAKKLAPFFLNGNVRLFGHGDWYRVDAQWQMSNFYAIDYVELDKKDLSSTISEIREVFSGVTPEDFQATMADLRRE